MPKRLSLALFVRIVRLASSEWVADNAMRLGAAVAFYTLLSLAPLIVILVGIGSYFYGPSATRGRLAWDIQGMAGAEVARTIDKLVVGTYHPGTSLLVTVLGLGMLTFGASSVFVELHEAMNTIWNVEKPRDQTPIAALLLLLRARFHSFVAVLCIGFLLLVSMGLNAMTAAVGISLAPVANFVVAYLVVAGLFASLYKVLPDVVLRWSDVAPGAAITALLFMGGKELLASYFSNSNLGSPYSAAGSPVVVLVWVYYSSQLFFWGAEFCKVYTITAGSQMGIAVASRLQRNP